jgi:transcriptional/translational regulatory protein YebC/TACO1
VDALTQAELEPGHAEVTMEPATRVGLNLGDAEKFMKLIERLEDLDDTQEVYHNADIAICWRYFSSSSANSCKA